MQDRRVAEIGDFGKFGLLRRICGCDGRFGDGRSLAVLWYRTIDGAAETPTARPAWLDRPDEFRPCDPLLFDTLDEIVASGLRETHSIEIAELLGDVAFHSDLWSFDGMSSQQMRDVERRRLFLGALKVVGENQVVCIDADAGPMPDGVVPNAPDATRWIGWDEMVALAALRRTLVVGRPAEDDVPIQRQVVRGAVELIERLRLDVRPIPMIFLGETSRVHFVIPAPDDVDTIQERCVSLVDSDDPWSHHFSLLGR